MSRNEYNMIDGTLMEISCQIENAMQVCTVIDKTCEELNEEEVFALVDAVHTKLGAIIELIDARNESFLSFAE